MGVPVRERHTRSFDLLHLRSVNRIEEAGFAVNDNEGSPYIRVGSKTSENGGGMTCLITTKTFGLIRFWCFTVQDVNGTAKRFENMARVRDPLLGEVCIHMLTKDFP